MCDVFIQHRYNVIYISHLMFSVSWNVVRVCVCVMCLYNTDIM